MAEQALTNKTRAVDGLFTSSLTLLEGTLRYVRGHGEQVSNSLQIGTYDDHPFLDYLSINISSVRQDIGKMAAVAVDMIRDMLAGKDGIKHEVIKPELVIR